MGNFNSKTTKMSETKPPPVESKTKKTRGMKLMDGGSLKLPISDIDTFEINIDDGRYFIIKIDNQNVVKFPIWDYSGISVRYLSKIRNRMYKKLIYYDDCYLDFGNLNGFINSLESFHKIKIVGGTPKRDVKIESIDGIKECGPFICYYNTPIYMNKIETMHYILY